MLYRKTKLDLSRESGFTSVGSNRETHTRKMKLSAGTFLMVAMASTTYGWLFKRDKFTINDVVFYLQTSSAPSRQALRLNQPDNIRSASFMRGKPVRFIIHGWMSHIRKPWIIQMSQALMKVTPQNVIIVDWNQGAKTINYFHAAKNTRVVGEALAKFILLLQRHFRVPRDQVHLIGHSLGGHVSANAGKRLRNPKIGRISGMDVPDIGFDVDDNDDTLDPSDADFVDEIHSQLSLSRKGHADFYPNGGLSNMPGCRESWDDTDSEDDVTSQDSVTSEDLEELFPDDDADPDTLARRKRDLMDTFNFLRCNHVIVTRFYQESVTNRSCRFRSRACSSWSNYQSGACRRNDVNFMGYHATPPRGGRKTYFLKLNERAPYCKA